MTWLHRLFFIICSLSSIQNPCKVVCFTGPYFVLIFKPFLHRFNNIVHSDNWIRNPFRFFPGHTLVGYFKFIFLFGRSHHNVQRHTFLRNRCWLQISFHSNCSFFDGSFQYLWKPYNVLSFRNKVSFFVEYFFDWWVSDPQLFYPLIF